MKSSLTLSTVLFALTLSPAAFANGAQEQTPAVQSPEASTATGVVTVFAVQQLPQVATVVRSVLEQLDLEVRAELLASLRAGSAAVIGAVQSAAPAVTEAARELDLSAR